ncbi:MAG: nucleoside hydrolase [Chloroflexota bacterium]
MTDRVPLLMDVDTGIDDAMAIALATQLESCDLVAVTTVAGNVTVDHATRNTLNVLSWMGSEAPVSRGMSEPLSRPLFSAADVHGKDGLGGWGIPTSERSVTGESAPETILRISREYEGRLTLVFVGPLTNLAAALKLDPTLPERVHELVIMGGAFQRPGNVTPHAEFNIFVDPEAAAAIARSSFRARWVGLDVTRQVRLTLEQWQSLAGVESPGAILVREVCRESIETKGLEGVTLHDPLALAAALEPSLIGNRAGIVTVATDHFRRGETRLTEATQDVEHEVAISVDSDRFMGMFRDCLAG